MTSNSEKAMDVCPALGKQLSLPDFRATILGSDEIKTMVTLAQGRGVVIDFWTTKCVRCPAAIAKLNDEAPKHADTAFFSCVLDNKEIATDVTDGEWENMTHLYVDHETKEQLKELFQFSQVPFCVVADKDFRVISFGNPKDMCLGDILSLPSESEPPIALNPGGRLVLDDDF